MTNTIRNILQDLERGRENMLALSDAISLEVVEGIAKLKRRRGSYVVFCRRELA